VCRELTKRFEEVVRGPLDELAEHFREPPKGEITLVLGEPATERAEADDDEAREAVVALVESGASRRTAADVVSRLTGRPRNELYRRSL
jgi:16S rRNA (cytidine1402-2'-O)-methyltransferase